MTPLATIPFTNFTGSVTSPAVSVPVGATDVSVAFDGTFMTDPALTVAAWIEFAPDGVTWQGVSSSTMHGGGHTRAGDPTPVYPVSGHLPEGGTNRKIRGGMTVSGALLTSVLTINTTP